jgi:carboxyl-terminal processing protease
MENNNSKYFLIPLGFAVFLSAGLWIGFHLSPGRENLSTGQQKYGKMRDIIEILDKKYVDPLNADKLFEKTISNMLHKLDPHSSYISAAELQSANEQIEGHFGGVGVRFSIIRDTICITHVINGSPSQRAGLLAGDRIIQVGGKSIASKKIKNEDVMKMLKGPEETPVNVVVYRNKKKLPKTIIRGSIPIESIVCATMLNKNTGYIKLDQFSVESAREFNRAALKLKAAGMTKLIFDLRNNGGGVLQVATQIVDEFLKDGAVIVTTKGLHTKKEIYTASLRGNLERTEVVVLINENSASASEIVAGALQDNDRATIMGRRSFGKGLVQEDIGLKDGSNLRLVVARYYTPTGRCIQKPYTDDYEEYYKDQMNRYENGELYAIDSTLLVDSLRFETPKGKVVYGGGGILPDVFIPLDTTGSSWYFTALRYSPAFQNFAFDFVSDKRNQWKNPIEFKNKFNVSEQLLDQFLTYAEKVEKIKKSKSELALSKNLIKQTLKAEIARQIWTEQGYFTVTCDYDKEVQKALKYLGK